MHTLSYRTITLAVCAVLIGTHHTSAAIMQSFQQTGQLNFEFVASGGNGNTGLANGTFNLVNPIGPAVQAYLYAADFGNLATPDLLFNGIPIAPNVVTTDTNLNGTMLGYRWDVTNHVIGAGSYSYAIGQTISGSQISAVGLVVYNDPGSVSRQVTIHDGIEQIGAMPNALDSKSYTFNNLIAGSTDVWLLSGFDSFDGSKPPSFESGETVTWNGTNVGGPLDAALGFNATLTKGTATSTAGVNTLTVSTGATPVDHFGVIAAVSVVTVPEPTCLAIVIVVGAVAAGRRPRYPVGYETHDT